jgi:hypothetical protein
MVQITTNPNMKIQLLQLTVIACIVLSCNIEAFQTSSRSVSAGTRGRLCTITPNTINMPKKDVVVTQASIAANIVNIGNSSKRSTSNSKRNNIGDSRDTTVILSDTPPPLKRHPSRKICLMVEPTPFTHVSGYANRFKEMLKFMKKAGDDVHILTVDSKTPEQQLPKEYSGYSISHTQGFTFPLYNHISLTIDLPEMKGAQLIEQSKPDLIHVTSPGFLVFAAMFYARVMKIPLVMSYHTHLPSYGTIYII